jgi:predicted MPP superfamily phosphohydrolase
MLALACQLLFVLAFAVGTSRLKEVRTLLTHHRVPDLQRIAVIGDLHGDAFCARRWVEHLGLVNFTTIASSESSSWEWIGDEHTLLVFMGDYIDRGPLSSETLWLVKNLTDRWPNRVVAILGNHELYMLEDRARDSEGSKYLHYSMAAVHPGEFESSMYGAGGFTEEDTQVQVLSYARDCQPFCINNTL